MAHPRRLYHSICEVLFLPLQTDPAMRISDSKLANLSHEYGRRQIYARHVAECTSLGLLCTVCGARRPHAPLCQHGELRWG